MKKHEHSHHISPSSSSGTILDHLLDSDLAGDETAALAMLSLVQAAYDSGKIGEAKYLQAESELVKRLSGKHFHDSSRQGSAGGQQPDQLVLLLKEREELERTLDMLADAVAAGRITEQAYEKLYVSNSEKLSRVLSQIDFVASSAPATGSDIARQQASFGQQHQTTLPGEDEKSGSVPTTNTSPATWPDSDRISSRVPRPALSSQKHAGQGASLLSGIKEAFGLSGQKQGESGLSSRAETFKESVVKDFGPSTAQQQSEWSSQASGLRQAVKALESLCQQNQSQLEKVRQDLGEADARMSASESQLRDRFAEMRSLVARVEEIHEAVKLSKDLAARTEAIHRQVLRTEKLAELMGRTFIDSTKKFNELEEYRHRQQAMSASLAALADSVKQLSQKVREQADSSGLDDIRAQVKVIKDDLARLDAMVTHGISPEKAQDKASAERGK